MAQFKPFVSSTGEIITPDSIEQARLYKTLGWAHAGDADYERDRVSKMYSESWADKALAFTQGVVQATPFMQTFQNNVVNPYLTIGGPDPSMAQNLQALTEANPGANWAGYATGIAGQLLPTTGVLGTPTFAKALGMGKASAAVTTAAEVAAPVAAQAAELAAPAVTSTISKGLAPAAGAVDNVAAAIAEPTTQMAAPALETAVKTTPIDIGEFVANRTALDFSAGKTIQQAVPKPDITQILKVGKAAESAVTGIADDIAKEAAKIITPEVTKTAMGKFSMGEALTAVEEKALRLMGPEMAAKLSGMSGTFGQAAASGIQSGIMGMGYSLDQASMQHALTGEGQEKLFASVGYDTLFAASVGFSMPLVGPALSKMGVFKTMGKAGQKLTEWSEQNAAKSMMTSQSMRELDNISQLKPTLKYINENKLSIMPLDKSRKWVGERLRVVGQEMQRVKDGFEGVLSIPQQAELRSLMKSTLNDDMDFKAIAGYMDTKKGVNLEKLHQLRDKLDEMIDWNNPFKGKNATYNEAREMVNDMANNLLRENDPSGAFANKWTATNNEYHILSQLKKAIGDKQGVVAERGSLTKIVKNWSAVGAVHLMTGGMVNGAAVKVAMKTAEVMKNSWQDGKFGAMGKILASQFLQTESNFSRVINSKLATMGAAQSPKTYDLMSEHADIAKTTREQLAYHEAALNDPMESIGMLGKHMVEAGMPEELVFANLSRYQAAAAFLYNERPKSPFTGKTIAPQEWTPDQSSMYKWLEQIDTMRYPELGIDDPSAHRLRVLETVYPEMLARTRAIISDAVATNPELSMEAQVWASKVLRAPANPLMDPMNYAIYAKARLANQPSDEQGMLGSTDPSSPDEDQMTGAQRIQGQGEL